MGFYATLGAAGQPGPAPGCTAPEHDPTAAECRCGGRLGAADWPCRLTGATMGSNRRPVDLDRALPGPWASTAGMARAVLAALARRKDGGRPFVGDAVKVLDPLGRSWTFIIEAEDWTGRLRAEWDFPSPAGRDVGSVTA